MFGIDDALMAQLALSGGSALAGGAMSLFGKNKPSQNIQIPNRTPGQISDMDQARQMAMQGLQDPSAGFQPIADQAMSRFRSDIVPGLAERFTSMGGGARGSSAYLGALSRAGGDLAGNLAGQQSQYGLQRMSGLQNLLGMGLGSQFDSIHQPEQPSFMQNVGAQMFGSGMQGLSGSLQGMQANKVASDKRNWNESENEKNRQQQLELARLMSQGNSGGGSPVNSYPVNSSPANYNNGYSNYGTSPQSYRNAGGYFGRGF